MKTCFIVCPIGKDGSDTRKNSDTVLDFIIEPICKELGFTVTRVDKLFGVDRIDNTIYQHLTDADLVIADMSEHNPNAFYEMGYRHALKKPLIPIMVEGTDIPFDLASLRTITYATNDLQKAEEAKNRLRETIQSFNFSKEDSTENHHTETQQVNLVPHLLKIQDEIEELKGLIQHKNDEVAATAVDLAMQQIQKTTTDPQNKMMEILLPQMFSNPEQFINFVDVAKKMGLDK